MKIVFISSNYPPTICGVGDHTYYLVQEMMRQGIDVHVICSASQTEAQSKGEVLYPVVKRWNTEGGRLVSKIIEDIQPDWVIVQMVAYAYNMKGLPWQMMSLYKNLRRLDVKTLTVFHEIRIKPEGNIIKWTLSNLQTYLARRLSKMSTKVVTSIDLYADMLKDFSDKLTVIPIGSNIIPVALNPEQSLQLRQKHAINSDATIICTFGNRNVETYLPAFDRLVKDNPQLIWLLCGRTQTTAQVLKSRTYIRYVGEMPADDVYRHLALGDVFFMPDPVNENGEGGSSNKSGSLACACSLGIPIVATKGNLNNALLLEGEKMILTDINDTNALYESLKMCLESKAVSKKMATNALRFYHEELTWAVLAEKFLSVLGVPQRKQKRHAVDIQL
jgi:glycosyltransferase involved in cell wall biosynthesis